jgi:hypothetical protein
VADINVERKGPSVWPWIVGLIVLALLIWALLEMFGRDTTTRTVVPADTIQVQDTVGWQPGTGDTIIGQPGRPATTPPN